MAIKRRELLFLVAASSLPEYYELHDAVFDPAIAKACAKPDELNESAFLLCCSSLRLSISSTTYEDQ